MRYYIADLHFCHNNLNDHMDCRGFKSTEDMNEYMIAKWNSRVRSNDEVVRRYKVEIDDENMTWTDSNGEKTKLVKKQEE